MGHHQETDRFCKIRFYNDIPGLKSKLDMKFQCSTFKWLVIFHYKSWGVDFYIQRVHKLHIISSYFINMWKYQVNQMDLWISIDLMNYFYFIDLKKPWFTDRDNWCTFSFFCCKDNGHFSFNTSIKNYL